ncbi:MAG: hypothetical protein PWP52_901 [Bacteroidales bacterium]|nr:hypothetical protein [Eubacteriaceae bacterium]MDK2978187.1 hypothetical protein [Bacteroidales bacterium]
MKIEEAMQSRHMVRKYKDKPIPVEVIKQLNDRINENNDKYDLSIKLMVNDKKAFNAVIKMILAKGVNNYLILAGKDRPDLDEKLGYCGADLMLFAQTLGLNTWWAGGTINKKRTSQEVGGQKVVGIVSIGYGATQGVSHKSKKAEDISSYKGTAPEWFINGVNAALLAPTALNKQAFFIKGEGNKVSMSCDNGIFTGADLGLGKYHFEIGAGKDNFEWV